MGSNRRMDHMTWPEFKEAKTRPVIVPIGSTEQHGQHLPIGTDAVLATRVAEDLAQLAELGRQGRLAEVEALGGAGDVAFGQQRVQRDEQVEVDPAQVGGVDVHE